VQAIRSSRREQDEAPAGQRTGRLMVTGAALSIDNLAVGFALGTFHVNLAVAAVVIAVVRASSDDDLPREVRRDVAPGAAMIGRDFPSLPSVLNVKQPL
jgi:hypothetical protein